jgi:hypothetical protein
MCFLGNNYTGAYRVANDTVGNIRVMMSGCPAKFVATTTHTNVRLHWHLLDHISIQAKLPQVMETMNKEDRNNYVIPLPQWLVCFIPNLHFPATHS